MNRPTLFLLIIAVCVFGTGVVLRPGIIEELVDLTVPSDFLPRNEAYADQATSEPPFQQLDYGTDDDTGSVFSRRPEEDATSNVGEDIPGVVATPTGAYGADYSDGQQPVSNWSGDLSQDAGGSAWDRFQRKQRAAKAAEHSDSVIPRDWNQWPDEAEYAASGDAEGGQPGVARITPTTPGEAVQGQPSVATSNSGYVFEATQHSAAETQGLPEPHIWSPAPPRPSTENPYARAETPPSRDLEPVVPGPERFDVRPLPPVYRESGPPLVDVAALPAYPSTSQIASTGLRAQPTRPGYPDVARQNMPMRPSPQNTNSVQNNRPPHSPSPAQTADARQGVRRPYIATEPGPVRNMGQQPPAPERTAIEQPVVAELVPIQGATELAKVGDDVILASEVLFMVRPVLEEQIKLWRERTGGQATEAQEAELRDMMTQQLLQGALAARVKDKLLCQDMARSLPPEAYTGIHDEVMVRFEEEELPEIIVGLGHASLADYAQELIGFGSSLDTVKRVYVEKHMALMWEHQQAVAKNEPSLDDLYDYYDAHVDEYTTKARARWEQLSVRYPTSDVTSEQQAWAKLSAMGRAVQQGYAFAEVAKKDSDGPTASSGGARDWTYPGDMNSEVLNETIFQLPVGRLSPILKTDNGLQIIRVVEREDTQTTPFEEAQFDIRKKLQETAKEEALVEFRKKIMDEIPVQTIFDTEQMADQRAGSPTRVPVLQ